MKNLFPETVTLLRMARATASPELAKEIDLLLADHPESEGNQPTPGLAQAVHQLVTYGGTVMVNPAPESPSPSEKVGVMRRTDPLMAMKLDPEYQRIERKQEQPPAPTETGLQRETEVGSPEWLEAMAQRQWELRMQARLSAPDHPPSVEPHP